MPDRIVHVSELAKHAADLTAGSVTIGAILQFLPAWAALFTIIWTGLRIFDWIETRMEKRADAKLRNKVKK